MWRGEWLSFYKCGLLNERFNSSPFQAYSNSIANNMAEALTGIKIPAIKPFGLEWGTMQARETDDINFEELDRIVRAYQDRGHTKIMIALKSHSSWASVDCCLPGSSNPSPKPKYMDLYEEWIKKTVERYDMDGNDDMDDLRWPVRYFEIGSEFSSYEPEPVTDYIAMLKRAYDAAHSAYSDVIVAHAAFLTTPVNLDLAPGSTDYESAWSNTKHRDTNHLLDDIRVVLDNYALFDVVNLHNLGSPYELEFQKRWLDYEMDQRGYSKPYKPYIVSDTLPTPYIAWGPATRCVNSIFGLGLMVPPAVEADRCNIAAMFQKLVNKDEPTLAWARGHIAADMVQKAVIASEQGFDYINLSFTNDLSFPVDLTSPLSQAGGGLSAWGGAINIGQYNAVVDKFHPLFYALKQMMEHFNSFTSLQRVTGTLANDQARIYKVNVNSGNFWIAWLDPQRALLPGDDPSLEVTLQVGDSIARSESVITAIGQEAGKVKPVSVTPAGVATLQLTHTPIYIFIGANSPPVPAPTEAPSAAPTAAPTARSPTCFSSSNKVHVLGRGEIQMNSLKIGDRILAEHNKYSRVFGFAHRDPDSEAEFVEIRVVGNSTIRETTLEISAEHLMFADSGKSMLAASVKVGDRLIGRSNQQQQQIVRVEAIQNITRRGIYAPLTETGTLLVNGILVSSYASLNDSPLFRSQNIAHAFVAGRRLLCTVNFDTCTAETYTSDGIPHWILPALSLYKRIFASQLRYSTWVQVCAIVVVLPLVFGIYAVEQLLLSSILTKTMILACVAFCWKFQRMVNARKMSQRIGSKRSLAK